MKADLPAISALTTIAGFFVKFCVQPNAWLCTRMCTRMQCCFYTAAPKLQLRLRSGCPCTAGQPAHGGSKSLSPTRITSAAGHAKA